ncbi:MAG: response regulator, partial [Desulfobacterales bacterium]|nr:response regulator [Desulfobacterales bacterium]
MESGRAAHVKDPIEPGRRPGSGAMAPDVHLDWRNIMNDQRDPRSSTILAIDDTLANLRLLASILRNAGCVVLTANNGGPGLEVARDKRPDLILLDIVMEDMSGYDVCERLKADARTRDIPVIMISSLSEVMEKIKAFSLGAVDYITKPFQREEVLARVRTHLDLQRMQRGLREKNRLLVREVGERKRVEEALNQLNLELEDRVAQRTVRLRAEIVRREKAELEIRNHRDRLEGLVAERTKELTKTNRTLQREIEERKQAEERAREAKELADAANRAKSVFLANMSHEIRTPLNGVVGMTELLMGSGLTARQKEYAEAVSASAGSLLTILNDILDFSKIQAGKLVLESVDFNLRKVADQVGWVMAGQAREKGIDILVWYPPDTPSRVVGDPTRTRQILTNLANNAVKFTERGHVLIEVESERTTRDRRDFVVRVSDTGVGIPADRRKTIFGKFSQADESTTRKFGGAGLGLAISKQLVEMMGGEIGVTSAPGKGSTFFFRLELPCREEARSERDAGFHLSGVPVLVVDDNEINRRIATRYLESRDIPCETVSSGEEALYALKRARREGKPFRIAVLDYFMPVMNGGDLAEAIKTDEEIRDTVLVLLSSGAPAGELNASIRAHFAANVLKPIRIHLFLQTLLESWRRSNEGSAPPPGERAPRWKKKEEPPFINARALLVEDNRMNQRVASGILKKFGCRVDVAENGMAAINLLDGQSYDMVFMDANMPVMDGFETTRYIRRQETGEDRIPIIAMTALAMEGDRERCLDAGMDDYLSKPIQSQAVLSVLRKFCFHREASARPSPADPAPAGPSPA